jgi:AraC-like DNA-binding protein
MTNDPGRPWTVAMLGRIVGLSRAAFARRFAASVGMAPRTWLTRHRLHLAQQQLVHTDAGLAALATRLGYASEFAFAKAFKRIVGVAPGQFRRLARRTAQNPAFLPRAAA